MPAKHKTVKKEIKLQDFVYVGTDKRGQKTQGIMPASSINFAKAELRRQGITPLSIRKKPLPIFTRREKKINSKDVCVFSRQLATMIKSGVPLLQSLDIVGRGHANPSMQNMLTRIKTDIEGGNSLSESLNNHPKQFDKLYCSLIAVGEQSGSLDRMLDRIASYKEKMESIKAKVKKAMFYPIAVLAVAIVVSSVLLLWVVPQFESLFKSFGADLPVFTKMVMGLSKWLRTAWWMIIAIFFGAGVGFKMALRQSEHFAFLVDKYVLRIYVVGDILMKSSIARFCRTLATTFAAGVPLLDALKSVSNAAGNLVFTKAIREIGEGVSTGQQLQLAMRNTGLFPNMVIQMVAIGEEAGSLDAMLSKIADFYEEDVDNKVDALSSLIEPLILVILGVLIGGLIVAMYLPIFQMGGVVG